MANTYLSRSISGGNQKTFTLSVWVKRSEIGSNVYGTILSYADSVGGGGGTPRGEIILYEDKLQFGMNPTGNSWSTFNTGTRRFRDTSAWYHIVVAVDTTQGTASNRLKMYVNGELQTLSSAPDTQNFNTGFNKNSSTNHIGRSTSGTGNFFSGCMAHYHFVDGSALAATVFGSVDSVTGEWQINTSPSFTPGTNGFTILKDGNTITDQSSNSNNWSSNGAGVTTTKDCPSNNFPTFIAAGHTGSYKFYNGATTSFGDGTSDWTKSTIGTLGASDGKYYWEIKLGMNGGATDYNITGVVRSDKAWSNSNVYSNGGFNGLQSANAAGGLGIYSQTGASMGGALYIGGSSVNLTNGDIVMYALDLDNRKLWVGKNGTWADDGNSGYVGNPTTGAYPLWGTGEFTTGATYLPCNIQYQTSDCSYNFGNGYFKTTAVSSAGTNASGNGIFEYDVPTGYTALSTKGLNL